MRGHLKRYVLVFGLALLFPVIAPAGAKFQKIQRPGAVDTLPSSINDAGCIVGTSETAAQAAAFTEEGFRLCEDTYTTIFKPGARDTDLGGINNQGKIVGTWGDSSGNDHCFLWANGSYTSFNINLDTHGFTDCNGINQDGDTVGIYTDSSNHGWLKTHGGSLFTLNVTFTGATSTEANGINKARDIVGSWCCNLLNNDSGFLRRHDGAYKEIDFPGSSTTSTDAYGINDDGDIVGSYTAGKDHGFVRRDDEYTTIDVPFSDALETNKVTGINNRGCMVGVYTSTDTHEYGFKAGLRAVDGDGEEAGKKGGRAHMHVHEDDCIEQPDREDYSDPGAGKEFHSTQNTAVTYDTIAHSVTIAGLGTNNGSQVAFTIVMVDSSLVPPGIFSITLSDGYSNTGSLLAGAITLH